MGPPMDEVLVDAETGEAYREVRPDEPLARGFLSVPAWGAYAIGGLAFALVVVALVQLAQRKR